MPQSAKSGRTDFRHPAPWSLLSAALRWGTVVVLGYLGLLVHTTGAPAATAPSEAHGFPVRLGCGEGTVTFKLRSKPVVTNVTEHSLALPAYRYGGLGFRGLDAWDGAPNCRFLSSEGVTNRVTGNEFRARWCWIGGAAQSVEGGDGIAGVVLLAHPSNFRFPEPMRIHPTEPFFCWSPQQAGDFALPPRNVHAMRYRILVADGPPDPKEIEQQWLEWSREP